MAVPVLDSDLVLLDRGIPAPYVFRQDLVSLRFDDIKNLGLVAIVDDEDYKLLKHLTWHANKKGNTHYATHAWRFDGKVIQIDMHRVVCFGGHEVDHINGNGLDNRRSNLRPCSRLQNSWNKKIQTNNNSGVTGVGVERPGRWYARIRVNKFRFRLGYFHTKESAIAARKAAELKYYGEFAPR